MVRKNVPFARTHGEAAVPLVVRGVIVIRRHAPRRRRSLCLRLKGRQNQSHKRRHTSSNPIQQLRPYFCPPGFRQQASFLATTSTAKELCLSLGADEVIDYRETDW